MAPLKTPRKSLARDRRNFDYPRMHVSAPRRRPRDWLELGLLALCLLAPSLWMLLNVPPLWRDLDGYNQLIYDPRSTTIWGFGPAYGYLAKVPVLLAGGIEHVISGAPMFPALSDWSAGALIVTQHLALAAAALGFIRAVARLFWVRLGLCLLWASHALFYTYAHSVGSESLSVIVIILFVTQCLRLVRAQSEPAWANWYLFALALLACLLTRQINGLLALLLPAASLLEWMLLRLKRSAAGNTSPAALHREKESGRRLVLCTAIGIATVLASSWATQNLGKKGKSRPHSRVGATFVWRLQFLKTLEPPARDALLRAVADRARSEDSRQLLVLVRQMCDDGTFAPMLFMRRGLALMPEGQARGGWARLDRALNTMTFAFLVPPGPELLAAAGADFAKARSESVTGVADFVFEATAFYFEFQADMPHCAGLVTFRNYDAAALK
ncbi:MAG TPA: hypothetical protein VF511_04905, partial [Chthoniobacterales bacterium]